MILPLEKRVPTRETCERLRDAGFPIESHYVWVEQGFEAEVLSKRSTVSELNRERVRPAPTAAELGALLPTLIRHEQAPVHSNQLGSYKSSSAWTAFYDDTAIGDAVICKHATTEAEARALLWLDLHEKDLLPDAAYGASFH